MVGIIKPTCRSLLIGGMLLGMVLTACDGEKKKTYTVGAINVVKDLENILDGFKKGMEDLGYIEGKNIRYIYHGPTSDQDKLSTAVQELLEAKVDIILSITTLATKAAKEATGGSGLPVVFVAVTDPLGADIVDSIQRPGGNVTGIAFGIQEGRRLEWLIRIAPTVKQIYVPYNSKDQAPVLALKIVRDTAAKLGIKLIPREFHNLEMLNDAVLNIPPEADAVFLLPDSLLSTRLTDLVAAANKRNLPTSGANITAVYKNPILTSFGSDQHLTGKQSARLVDQIFKGTRPADLPVEMDEFYLVINLKVAETIGLTIPDGILRQADFIIR